MIGVTGGIGSGKSTVCRIFEVLGAKVYYADERAKWLMENDPTLISAIKDLFGEQAYSADELDRSYLASRIYEDDNIRKKLNQLVHPAVGKDAKKWAHDNRNSPLLLQEAALLFETGSYKKLDKNLLVTAPEGLRIERVVSRDAHRTEDDVKAIIAKQMPDQEKVLLADYTIVNDGKQSLIKQVQKVYEKLIVA